LGLLCSLHGTVLDLLDFKVPMGKRSLEWLGLGGVFEEVLPPTTVSGNGQQYGNGEGSTHGQRRRLIAIGSCGTAVEGRAPLAAVLEHEALHVHIAQI